jgi:hypothetical protein
MKLGKMVAYKVTRGTHAPEILLRVAVMKREGDFECVEVFCEDFYGVQFNFAYSSGGFFGEGQPAIENKDLVQIVFDEKTGQKNMLCGVERKWPEKKEIIQPML